jgi:hypothetical protein
VSDTSASRPKERLAGCGDRDNAGDVTEPVIERAEVVALLFNVSDIAESVRLIERILEEDDGEEEDHEG